MIRLNKMTDYGIVVMVRLAVTGERMQTAPEIAAATGLKPPTVAKVLKTLAQGGLVVSQRGAQGGYTLARPAERISMVEALEVLDGPLSLTACVDSDHDGCERGSLCPMCGRWDRVNAAIVEAIDHLSLADMISPFDYYTDGATPQAARATAAPAATERA